MSLIRLRPISLVALCALLSGCASQDARDQLPFHVAIVPVVVKALHTGATPDEGSLAEIVLDFDSGALSAALADNLSDSVLKVTRLSPSIGAEAPAEDELDEAWLNEAEEQGADLILHTTLAFLPTIHTALNDRFYLNLPLFALGGPATWFVNDRSYYFYVRFEVELFDRAAAMRNHLGSVAAGTAPSRVRALSSVLRIERENREISLNFLDRSGGLGAWAASLVIPAGFVAPESDAASEELHAAITKELGDAIAQALKERSVEIERCDLVDFHPDGVHVTEDGDQRYLEGEMVLRLGDVSELGALGYRFGDGEFVAASWSSDTRRDGARHYGFQIPLNGTDSESVQLEVEQLDRFASRRTFTFSLDESPQP